MTSDPHLEVIEAMIWRTGTRNRVLVAAIMAAVRAYGRAAPQRPWPPYRTATATAARTRRRS